MSIARDNIYSNLHVHCRTWFHLRSQHCFQNNMVTEEQVLSQSYVQPEFEKWASWRHVPGPPTNVCQSFGTFFIIFPGLGIHRTPFWLKAGVVYTLLFFLKARAGRTLWILPSDWFWEQARFSYLACATRLALPKRKRLISAMWKRENWGNSFAQKMLYISRNTMQEYGRLF